MASERLKSAGISLKLDGAATFQGDLDKVAAKLRANAAELKKVQYQYQGNEKSIGALTEKKKALASGLEIQKEKTQKWKDVLDETTRKLKENGDAQAENSVDAQKLRAVIAESEAYEAQFEAQLRETQKAIDDQTPSLKKYASQLLTAGKGIEGFGDKVSGAGKKLTVGVTVPVTGLATAAVAAFNEVDDGYDVIINKTGATGKALEQMQDVAKNVYTSMPVEMSDVGAAVGELNTRLDIQGEALESATKQTLQFARVNNVDAESTIQKVTRYMGDASIEASKYGSVLDDLTVAGQKTGISVDTLAEYLTKYGAPLRALGFETKESIALFSQWEKSGVNVEIAFSGMKKAISKWASDGKDSREEFKKTLAEIKACPDIAAATTKAIEVFGAKAGPDLADAIQGGRFAYEDLLSVIESSEGTLSGTYDSLLDGADSANVALNNAKITLSNLGDTILTSAAPMIEDFTECIKNLGEWYSSLDSGTQKAIVKTGAFFALLGPGMSLLGKTISTGSKAVKGIKKISKCLETSKMAAKLFAKEADGAATTMNNMAKASNAASLASKGVYTAASPAAVGVAALAASGALIIGTFAAAKKSQEDFAESLRQVPKAMSDFNNSVEAAKGNITSLNEELFMTSSESASIDQGIEKAQQNIIGIAKRAAEESRAITDAEYKEIERLVNAIDSYTAKKLEACQAAQGAVAAIIQTETNMTASAAADYTAQAENAYNEAIEAAKKAKVDAYTVAYTAFHEQEELWKSGKIDEAAYNTAKDNYTNALNNANEKYDTAMTQANGLLSSSVEEVARKYEQQNIANDKNIQLIIQKQQELENAKKRAEELAAEYGRLEESGASQDELDKVLKEHDQAWRDYEACSDDLEDSLSSLSEKSAEMLGTWLSLTSEAELFGGKASENAKTMTTAITDGLDKLPSDVKTVYKDAMSGALEGLKEKEPELYEEATTSGNGVLKAMREAFDEHSPSKETKKIYKYAMDGAIEGLKDKEKALYKKADEIAANTAKRLKKGLEVNSPSRVVRRIFWSVGEGGILGLKDKEKELYTTSARLASGVAKNLNIQRPAFDVSFGSIAAAQARANRIASSISNTTNYTTSTDYSQHDYGIHVDRVVVNGSESDAYRWLEQVEYQRQLQARARGAR